MRKTVGIGNGRNNFERIVGPVRRYAFKREEDLSEEEKDAEERLWMEYHHNSVVYDPDQQRISDAFADSDWEAEWKYYRRDKEENYWSSERHDGEGFSEYASRMRRRERFWWLDDYELSEFLEEMVLGEEEDNY